MKPWLVVPVRSIRDGKQRLANVLSEHERVRLNTMLLEHVLAEAARFPGRGRTLVVTRCAEVAAAAHRAGAEWLIERNRTGMNSALDEARAHLGTHRGSRLMTVSCDLPLLCADDLIALATAAPETTGVALARDHTGCGTNALCLPLDVPFAFGFGKDSAGRHRSAAARNGLPVVEVQRPGLAVDLDTPADLQALRFVVPWLWPHARAA
jgi:2-phospho-L-lactate guanylyltransferase